MIYKKLNVVIKILYLLKSSKVHDEVFHQKGLLKKVMRNESTVYTYYVSQDSHLIDDEW